VQTFAGEEAVRWLRAALGGASVEAARATGDAMIYLGLLHHVTFEHMLRNSTQLLYRFSPQVSLTLTRRGAVERSELRQLLRSGRSHVWLGAWWTIVLRSSATVPQRETSFEPARV